MANMAIAKLHGWPPGIEAQRVIIVVKVRRGALANGTGGGPSGTVKSIVRGDGEHGGPHVLFPVDR